MTDVMTNDILNGIKGLMTSGDFEALQTLGVPTSKLEDWRYSSLASFIPTQRFNAGTGRITPQIQEVLALYPERLVFRAGLIDHELTNLSASSSLSDGESTPFETQNFVSLLGSALAKNSHSLQVAAKSSGTLALIHLPTEGGAALGSVLKVTLEREANLELIEIQLPSAETAPAWDNHILEVEVAPNATLRHVKLVSTGNESLSLGRTKAVVKGHGTYAQTLVTLGGKLAREEVEIRLEDVGAHGEIRALAALKNEEQADLTVLIHHGAPHTTSAQLVKNILGDRARGVFTGKIYIKKDAIGVDSSQLSKALLLSRLAQMNARPQLEIYADDVKAGHGATIGQLSEEEIFYLQTRGLTSAKARQMLCHGFGLEVLEEIRDSRTKEFIAELIFQEFEQHTISAPVSEES